LWAKGKNYVGYVGLVGKNLESYVEMVAGLPIKKTNLNDQELLRANVLNEFSIANVLEIKLKCLKNGFAKNTLKTLN
jgi:hypothetical protein